MIDVAKNLIEARKALGKSQADVSRETGIKQTTLSNYEQGTRVPKDDIKIKLAEYFGKSIEELFFTNNVHKRGSRRKKASK